MIFIFYFAGDCFSFDSKWDGFDVTLVEMRGEIIEIFPRFSRVRGEMCTFSFLSFRGNIWVERDGLEIVL